MPLFYLSLALLAGLALAASPVWAIVASGLGLAGLVALASFKGWGRYLFLPVLCLLALGVGVLRGELADPGAEGQALRTHNDTGSLEIVGVVVADPEPLGRTTRLRLEVRQLARPGALPEAASGLVLVSAPPYPDLGLGRGFPYYRYGDTLRLRGVLRTPPQLPDFDYREYLARQGIYSLMSFPQKVELAAEGQGLAPLLWLYRLRQGLSASLGAALPEPQAALAQAALLGQRSQLPDDLREAFARSGTSHLVAISGYNLTLLLGLVVAAATGLWGRHRPYYFVVGMGVVWAYTLLTGAAPPVVRAALMGSLWLTASFLGRPGSAGTALVFSAALMAGLAPELLGDVSFQLSFAAMAGLVFLAPTLAQWGRGLLARWGWEESRSSRWLTEGMAVAASAVLLTLPIAAVNFRQVSLVGLPATLLGSLILPGIILLGGLAAFGGLLWGPLGQALGWLAWPFLTGLVEIARGFASLPLAALAVGEVSPPWAWGYYGLLAVLLILARRWEHLPALAPKLASGAPGLWGARLRWLFPSLLLSNALVWGAVFTLPPQRLQVLFLDVGQGDAILIRTPHNRKLLIDGGPSPAALNSQLGKHLPFWDRTLDIVVLTHPDSDHLAGLVEALRRYQVKQVLEGGPPASGRAASPSKDMYREWETLLSARAVPRQRAQAGMRLELEPGVWLEVLHPPVSPAPDLLSDEDDAGAVLRLAAGETSFLFAADLRVKEELFLLAQGPVRSTVLKVAHHGSATSTSPEWLEGVSPQIAIVQVAGSNPFGHPDPGVLGRLKGRLGESRVYLTSQRGTVTVTLGDGRLEMATER